MTGYDEGPSASPSPLHSLGILDVSLEDEDHHGDDDADDEARVVEEFIVREVKIVKSDFCGCPT